MSTTAAEPKPKTDKRSAKAAVIACRFQKSHPSADKIDVRFLFGDNWRVNVWLDHRIVYSEFITDGGV